MGTFKTTNFSRVRAQNLSCVLTLIRQKGAISRAALARQTGLSATTISAITADLLQTGVITESGVGQSSGGRPPILLAFNYDFRYVLGVDMGSTHVTAVLMNLEGKIIIHRTLPFDVVHDPPGAITLICDLIPQMIESAQIDAAHILGMGITIPSPLGGKNLDQITTIYMPRWEGVDLLAEVGKCLSFSSYLDNDANAGAIAEKWWGQGCGYSNLAYIKLGLGVGSGLILNDEIYRGAGGTAGEIGHTTINVDGPLCRCGNYGCMEAYVGVQAIVRQVIERKQTAVSGWRTPQDYGIEEVIAAALDGDLVCRAVIEDTGAYLGISIANLINLFNPELIILGGGLTAAGALLTDAVRRSVATRTMFKAAREATITISRLGENTVAIGGATLALQHAFEPSRLAAIMAGQS